MTIEANILRKIAVFETASNDWTKPEGFRALARHTVAELRWKLEQHQEAAR